MIVPQSERLRLRPMTMSDASDLLKIFSDPEAMRYYPGTKNRHQTEDWIEWNLESYARYGFGLWVAEFKQTGEFAGQCGLVAQDIEGVTEVEIGYLFLRKLWGRGLATEAARACRDHASGKLGLNRLISLIHPGNIPSRRVAEKVGMTLEREVEKWGGTLCLYSMESSRLKVSHERAGANIHLH
jgi:RimJ/RimL family protein N-acetyltransferase